MWERKQVCENEKQVTGKERETSHFSQLTYRPRPPSQHGGNKALNQGVCSGRTGVREGESGGEVLRAGIEVRGSHFLG